MTRYINKQTAFGKYTVEDCELIYDSLLPTGTSREYIDMMTDQLVQQMVLHGAKQFGPEQAREIVLVFIATERFVPKPLKQNSFDWRL